MHRDVKLANVIVSGFHAGSPTARGDGNENSNGNDDGDGDGDGDSGGGGGGGGEGRAEEFGAHGTSNISACLIDWGLAAQLPLPGEHQHLSKLGTLGYKDPVIPLAEAIGANTRVAADTTKVRGVAWRGRHMQRETRQGRSAAVTDPLFVAL